MAILTSKRGSLDNIATYEHFCDYTADLTNIDPYQITLGSVAIVLQGTSGLEVYMANSQKQWVSLFGTSNSGNGSNSGPTADNTTLTE